MAGDGVFEAERSYHGEMMGNATWFAMSQFSTMMNHSA